MVLSKALYKLQELNVEFASESELAKQNYFFPPRAVSGKSHWELQRVGSPCVWLFLVR